MKNKSQIFYFILTALFIGSCTPGQQDPIPQQRNSAMERVLIRCTVSCDQVASQVESTGGRVTNRYRNVAAVAAEVPGAQINTLGKQFGRHAISKDIQLRIPKPREFQGKPISHVLSRLPLDHDDQITTSVEYNFPLTGAGELHEQSITGQDVVVAVIDTGTANNPERVPSLAGSVVGGENFVPGDEEPSATSTLNDDHGTWVASLIAAHTAFVLPPDDELVLSLQKHAPDTLTSTDDGNIAIPMMGTAPEAKIYALKTFAADGGGSPQSRVLAAMDRALTLKTNFNNGVPAAPVGGSGTEDNPYVYDSLNIQVVNLSLGGPTLYPGHDLEDQMVLKMLEAGMVVVVAAGNEGPAAITVGSPATSPAAISVGAASSALHERVLRDLQFGPEAGTAFRPTDHFQTAYFSSRGPNADGRIGPQVMANGVATFVQGADGGLGFISGTSLSSPTVAGAAASLLSAHPDKPANLIRMALLETANDHIIADRSGQYDQGFGYIDLPAALAWLDDTDDSAPLPTINPLPKPRQIYRMLEDVDIIDVENDGLEQEVTLTPGQVTNVFLRCDDEIGSLLVEFNDVQPELPLEQQNMFFGDDLLVSIVDAPTSLNDIVFEGFIAESTAVTIERPQTGLVRVAVAGDWTNAGTINATIKVSATKREEPEEVLKGELTDGVTHDALMQVVPGTTAIDVELAWEAGWDHLPAHDLDIYLIDPDGNLYIDGATLAAPERIHIDDPLPGFWTVFIDGYEVHGFKDEYELSARDQDGRRLKVR